MALSDIRKVYAGIAIGSLLWFVMFSPWTSHMVNFWWMMAFSGIILTTYSLINGNDWKKRILTSNWPVQILFGIAIAIVLWGVFWTGDKLSQLLFDFARPQVDNIYGMKGGMPDGLIALLLLFVIGPAEEIFWRGYVQDKLSRKFCDMSSCKITDIRSWYGFIAALFCYTFVHIWSFNFMLIVAAAACGFCWGVLYRLFPKHLAALIISHSLWDVAAFVIFPF